MRIWTMEFAGVPKSKTTLKSFKIVYASEDQLQAVIDACLNVQKTYKQPQLLSIRRATHAEELKLVGKKQTIYVE